MAEFLPAEHWRKEVSSRKHTRPPPHKDASWNFLRGNGPSAPEVTQLPSGFQASCTCSGEKQTRTILQDGALMTTSKAAFKPGWKEHRHEDKIQPSRERLAYERVQVCQMS